MSIDKHGNTAAPTIFSIPSQFLTNVRYAFVVAEHYIQISHQAQLDLTISIWKSILQDPSFVISDPAFCAKLFKSTLKVSLNPCSCVTSLIEFEILI
jgi:hypothetical protein